MSAIVYPEKYTWPDAKHLLMLEAKLCPYCNAEVKETTEQAIYGRTYKGRKIFACVNFPKCDSYVGSHDDGRPCGRVANKDLRALRNMAHKYFDKIWLKHDLYDREELYEDLSWYLKIPRQYTHMGMFGPDTCTKVIFFSIQLLNNIHLFKNG